MRSEFFGVVQGPLDAQDYQGMSDAQVHTDRFILKWGWVEPDPGTYSWGSMDRFVGGLASHGIRLLPSVWGNPDWVAGSSSTPPIGGQQGELAWRNFLKAVVARYGRGGTYWSGRYRQVYGPGATPLPIQAWQIWNEPNLKKFFAPAPSPGQYARLVGVSHDAIKSKDPQAGIVLAGMPSHGDINAWDFLNKLYAIAPGVKSDFDAVALHPYAASLLLVREAIQKVRAAMTNHADQATPLWITELAWGSAPPDGGLNKGPTGQASMLAGAYNLILEHRKGWNVQRLFWYHWRDPQQPEANCSFCSTAGLLNYDFTQKPAYTTFTGFTADTTPPVATINSGPTDGGVTNNPTPTFSFSSNEPGSTFQCRVDANSFKACDSPFTTSYLSNSAHTFSVRAIDAPGNVGAAVSRTFNVVAP